MRKLTEEQMIEKVSKLYMKHGSKDMLEERIIPNVAEAMKLFPDHTPAKLLFAIQVCDWTPGYYRD